MYYAYSMIWQDLFLKKKIFFFLVDIILNILHFRVIKLALIIIIFAIMLKRNYMMNTILILKKILLILIICGKIVVILKL